VGPNSHQDLCSLWAKVHRTFFVERRRNRSGNINFPVLDILSRSGDIRDQSRRLYKIDRNFACFWPHIFFGGGVRAPNFWTWIIKFRQFPNMWRSFGAIGRGTLENAWRKKTRCPAVAGKADCTLHSRRSTQKLCRIYSFSVAAEAITKWGGQVKADSGEGFLGSCPLPTS